MADLAPRSRPFLLLLPTWLTLGLFFVLPLGIVLILSFAQRSPTGSISPVTDWWAYISSGKFLSNYAQSLDGLYLRIFWRSLWMAVLTTVLCAVIAYPAAYYLAIAAPTRWKGLLLALAVIPFWTSFLVRTYAWMLILRTQGLANDLLIAAHLIKEPLDLLYNQTSVMIGLVYGELPFMLLPVYASLEKLDRSLLEAASDLGAGKWSRFWRVTLPLTAPGLAAGTVLVFVPSLGQFVVSDLLGGSRSMLIGNMIQNQFTTARNQPFGSALALELTLLVLLLLIAYAAYARKRGEELL
ncbi:MAG: ABC transporter permease [Planctomycetota bacterium]|nr:ABC transporter permease [Planctomycetota bacterium]